MQNVGEVNYRGQLEQMPETGEASTGPQPKHAEVMVVSRETYMRTPVFRVVRVLTSILAKESDQADFARFAGRVESLLRAFHMKRFTRLLNLYTFFDPAHGAQALEREGVTTEAQVVALEMEFLAGLAEVLKKSSFRLLTDAQFKLATSSQFLLQLPVQVDLQKIDSSLLERYWLQHKDQDHDLPPFSRHYIIATRGYGMATKTGLFAEEKLNILLKRTFTSALDRLLSRGGPRAAEREAHLAKVRVALRRQQIGARPGDDFAGQSPVKQAPGAGALPPPALLGPGPGTEAAAEGEEQNVNFERVRLESLPLKSGEWFKSTTIKEPTFQNVFVLYRPALPEELDPSKTKKRRKKLSEGEQRKADQARLFRRPIVLRQYEDIPMADLEIVFPEKKTPNLTPMDWVTIIVTAVTGVAAILAVFQQKMQDTALLQAVVVAFITYLGRIYAGFQAAQKKYQQALADVVYQRQLDSGRGTLLNLFQQVIDQELKEAVVAYYMLLTQGKASTQELEMRCEDLMADEFEEAVDFDTTDACDKLLRLGIVSKDAEGRFIAVNMRRANEILGATTDEVVGEVLGPK